VERPGTDDLDARIGELEGRLAESESRMREIQALAHIGAWEWTLPELRSTWSEETLRIFGRSEGDAHPSMEELIAAVHPDDREGFQQFVERARQTEGPFQFRYRIIDAKGEIRHLHARGRTVADADGEPVRAYGTTQDVTEMRRYQAQLERAQRLESVGQLAGGVAHDFNNLLSVILNYTECLLAAIDDEEAAASLKEIERAAASAAQLTRRLLLFSRRDRSELRAIDLVVAVHEAEALLRRTIGEQIELTVDAPAGLQTVRLGAGEAEQVLVNLVVNARDAMPNGGTVAVTVVERGFAHARDDPIPGFPLGEPHLVLTVADEGIGMSEAVAAQAFDPFFTTKPRDQGTGLGLATVYGIVSHAGGHVEIESEPGKGAAVHVYLPVATDLEAAEPESGELSPATRPDGRRRAKTLGTGQTVLVVDDERSVGTIVGHMLAKHGYRACTASSGPDAEAMATAPGSDVELLLTDLRMPGMSGRELVDRVRCSRPGLPAVYMSGYGEDVSLEGPFDEAAIILQKPFTVEQLLRAVGDALVRG
jgi:two-component system, cell cycle sensor histidine kinase and response regulator CckA